MSDDLSPLITQLEDVTARMVATTCWEPTKFGELLASRVELCRKLVDRRDLDARAAVRIQALIRAGESLTAQVLSMRETTLAELAEAGAQRRFSSEIGRTVPGQAPSRHLDLRA